MVNASNASAAAGCLPASTACGDYSPACYPCPWGTVGANCETPWSSLHGAAAPLAAVSYATLGMACGVQFLRRLRSMRKRSAPGKWPAMHKVVLLFALSGFLFVPRFLLRPIYGRSNPPFFLPNVLDLSTTLVLVSSCLILTEEWSQIASSKLRRVRVRVSGEREWSTARVVKVTAITMIWILGIGGCILEQSLLPPAVGAGTDGTGGSTGGSDGLLPGTVRGGSLFDFRGVYETKSNAVKNLSHGVIGFTACVYSSVMLLRIRGRLKEGQRSEKTQKLVTTLLEYVVGINFCFTLDLGYAVVSASSRLRTPYYFEFPPCTILSEFLYIPDLMKLFVFMVCFWMTRDKQAATRERQSRPSTTSTNATSTYVAQEARTTPTEGPSSSRGASDGGIASDTADQGSDAPQSSNASTVVIEPTHVPTSAYAIATADGVAA
jgi:hypothetical protein